MKLSIIIVNYNSADLLSQCLHSIYVCPPRYPFEVVVVDNNSTDTSLAVVARDYTDVLIIKNLTNDGYARANNTGAAASKGEFLLFMNTDVIVRKDSLKKMIEYMDAHQKAGIFGPLLVGARGEIIQMSWGWNPLFMGEIVQRNFSSMKIQKYKIINKLVSKLQRGTFPVPLVLGASMLVRRSCFNDLGGFDNNLVLYFEEPDICLRARQKGWEVIFSSEMSMIHLLGKSSRNNINTLRLIYRQSQIYFYKKHGSRIERILLAVYLFFRLGIMRACVLFQKNESERGKINQFNRMFFNVLKGKIRITLS